MAHYRKDCITFFMTTCCNLACHYCYLKDSCLPEQSIDVDFAKVGIDDYFSRNPSRHIRFFGAGEPTLEFEKIVKIKDYAHSVSASKLTCEIQTNGVFSDHVADWISQNIDILWLSYDGPPFINNQQRVSKNGSLVSHIIEKNIGYIINSGKCTVVGARPTITPLNVNQQIELIEYFYKLGIKVVYSDPVFPPVSLDATSVLKIPSYPDFLMSYAKNYLEARKVAEDLGMFYGSILTVNFDEKTEIACRSCLPSPHLTTDGYVTSCDMSYLEYTLPELIYGKYDTATKKINYDLGKVRNIRLRRASNLSDCQGCDVLYNCAGGCLGEGLNETGSILGVKKDYCEAIRFLAKQLPQNQGHYPYLHP